MVWVRLPDDAIEDPHLDGVSDAAIVAYLRALGRSNRWALDGRVARATVTLETAREWVDAGLAEDQGETLRLVWLREFQPTADEIRERRRKDAERQDRNRRHRVGDHSRCDPDACRVLLSRRDSPRDTSRDSHRDTPRESRHPVPTRPDPSRPRGVEDGEGTGADEAEPSLRFHRGAGGGRAGLAPVIPRAEQIANLERWLEEQPDADPTSRKAAEKSLARLRREDAAS